MENREPIILIDDIHKTYEVGDQLVNALDGVDLTIYRNDYVAIMGPSGSGKSTLMNMLGCLDTPTSGRYVLNGTDVSDMDEDELAEVRNKEIGFVFQTFNLLPRYTAVENVAVPLIYAGVSKSRRLRRAEEALCSVGLGRADGKPRHEDVDRHHVPLRTDLPGGEHGDRGDARGGYRTSCAAHCPATGRPDRVGRIQSESDASGGCALRICLG